MYILESLVVPSVQLLLLLLVCTVSAILFNCATPEAISLGLDNLHSKSGLMQDLREAGVLLGVYANRLTPVAPDWTMADSTAPQPIRQDMDPEQYSEVVNGWIDKYRVQIIGGCCGISPKHISAIHAALKDRLLEI
jgi:S-methylmethionine-dependent homocysteine/selenocysteine methylase